MLILQNFLKFFHNITQACNNIKLFFALTLLHNQIASIQYKFRFKVRVHFESLPLLSTPKNLKVFQQTMETKEMKTQNKFLFLPVNWCGMVLRCCVTYFTIFSEPIFSGLLDSQNNRSNILITPNIVHINRYSWKSNQVFVYSYFFESNTNCIMRYSFHKQPFFATMNVLIAWPFTKCFSHV